MLRKVMEYLRKQEQIPVIDFTLDICSGSMYYSYLKEERNLSPDKIEALRDRLGVDHLSEAELEEYRAEIQEFIRKFIELDFDFEQFKESVEYLFDYEKQMLLEETLVVDYLIAVLWGRSVFGVDKKYEELLEILASCRKLMNRFQEICYLDCLLTYDYYQDPDKALNVLEELRQKTEGFDDSKLSTIYYSMGLKYYNLKKLLLSDYYLEKSLDMYRKMDNVKGILKAKNSLVSVYLVLKKYSTAVNMCETNVKLAKLINNRLELRIAYTSLFNCYHKLNMKDKASQTYKDAKEFIFNNNDAFATTGMFSTWITGMDYFEMDKEIIQIISHIKKNVPSYDKNLLLNAIISYYEIEDVNLKIDYLENQFLPIIHSREPHGWDKFVYSKLIKYYTIKGKYKKASQYSATLLELSVENYS
jgi:hypothetical protein